MNTDEIRIKRTYRPNVDAKLRCLFHVAAGRFPTIGELEAMKADLAPRNDHEQ